MKTLLQIQNTDYQIAVSFFNYTKKLHKIKFHPLEYQNSMEIKAQHNMEITNFEVVQDIKLNACKVSVQYKHRLIIVLYNSILVT